MFLSRNSLTAAAVLAVATAGLAADPPAEALRPTLAKAADKVAAHAKEKKIDQLNLVTPEGPTPPLANATPDGVLAVLKQELARAGVKLSEDVTTKVLVRYKDVTVGEDKQITQLKVITEVNDSNDPTRANRFPDTLTDKLLLARLGGQLSGPFELPLNDIAAEAAERIDKHGGKPEVEVVSVQGPRGENRGVEDMLVKALARQKTSRGPLLVTVGADVRLRLRYRVSGSTAAELKYVIEYELVDGRDEPLPLVHQVNKGSTPGPKPEPKPQPKPEAKPEPKEVPVKPKEKTKDDSGLKTLSLAVPVPVATPPEETDEQWRERWFNSFKGKVPMTIEKNEVRLTKGSDYGVEVWVNGKAVTPEQVNGQAVVWFNDGDEYQLAAFNRRKDKDGKPYYAAVGVRIDGLSIFALREGAGPDHLGIRESGLIPGWFVTNTKHHTFMAGMSDTSPAAKVLPPRTDTGTITVTFAPAWTEGQTPPVKGVRAGGDKPGVMGTQVGKEGKSEYKDEKLFNAEVQETVVIKYARKKK